MNDCQNCGETLAPEDRFCPGCGQPVDAQPTPQTGPHGPEVKAEDKSEVDQPVKRSRFKKLLLWVVLPVVVLAGVYISAWFMWNATYSNQIFRARTMSVTFDKANQTLAAACADGKIRLWDMGSKQITRQIQTDRPGIKIVTYGPKSHMLTCWDLDDVISVWDLKKNKIIGSTRWPQKKYTSGAVMADNLWVTVFRNKDDTISIYDPLRGKLLRSGKLEAGDALALSWDGRIVAAAGHGEIKLLDWNKGRIIRTFKVDQRPNVMALSSDGKTLALSGYTGDIGLYATDSGTRIRSIKWNGIFLASLAFSPDGNMLAAVGGNSSDTWGIVMIDTSSGARIQTLRHALWWQRALAFAGF